MREDIFVASIVCGRMKGAVSMDISVRAVKLAAF